MNKSIARKEISRVVKDNKETIVNEFYEFEFDKAAYSALNNIFDDYEYARDHGVYSDEDDFYLIDVDIVIEELQDRMLDEEEENIKERVLYEFLIPRWKGYKIWL